MSAKEFCVLLLVCVIWGLHFLVMKVTVGSIAPPLFYAALRMILVAALLSPFLKWHKGQMHLICAAGLGYGALNYAFTFPALGLTTASAAAIGIELYVPFSIILAVIFLGERIGWRRILGVALAFSGVAIIALARPEESVGPYFLLGLLMVALGGFSEAVGALFVKMIKQVGPLQLLAWFAVIGSLVLTPLSFVLETDQMDSFSHDNRVPFLMALGYSVLLVSVVAHSSYYWLLGRLEMYKVAGSGLITTVIAVAGSIIVLDEPLSWPLVIGGIMTLGGVALILLRNIQRTPKAKAPLSES